MSAANPLLVAVRIQACHANHSCMLQHLLCLAAALMPLALFNASPSLHPAPAPCSLFPNPYFLPALKPSSALNAIPALSACPAPTLLVFQSQQNSLPSPSPLMT